MNADKNKVRCAGCKHVWDLSSAPTSVGAPPRPSSTSLPVPDKNIWVRALLLTALVTLLNVWIFGRHAIMHKWPSTVRFYSLLGFSTAFLGDGLSFAEIDTWVSDNPAGRCKNVRITGHIINTSDETRIIPPLQFSFSGYREKDSPAPCLTRNWSHHLAHTRILPKETIEFEAHYTIPDEALDRVFVHVGF